MDGMREANRRAADGEVPGGDAEVPDTDRAPVPRPSSSPDASTRTPRGAAIRTSKSAVGDVDQNPSSLRSVGSVLHVRPSHESSGTNDRNRAEPPPRS
jgi:hypothetical protein